jgi:dTDP-4-amino-4,6-dideoxygalactose transaminase
MPISENVSRRVLSLPLSAELPIQDVDRICKVIVGVAR